MAVSACKSGDVAPSLPADHYVLTQGTLFPTAVGINVVADTVKIFICPLDAQCFAPNSASASIRLSKDKETRFVRLFTFVSDGAKRGLSPTSTDDSTSVQFGSDMYNVILKARHTSTTATGQGKTAEAILQVAKL